MLKGRGRESRPAASPTPAQVSARAAAAQQQAARPHAMPPSPTRLTLRTPTAQRPLPPPAKPEPDYEMVDFPSEQYVNAKLQPPPPPPPRPPTGHPAEAGASCGLCGGLGARVRCTECGRRALCASCDDMYHRHPKRRNHQRQALSQSQLRDERPPLPPKVAPPVPPPRRHKISGDRMSASPRPPSADQRSVTIGPHSLLHQSPIAPVNNMNQQHPMPAHLQAKFGTNPVAGHLGSMPYLPSTLPLAPGPQPHTNTMGHMTSAWGRPRTSLPGFNMPPNMQHMASENWENQESVVQAHSWGRPLRRGTSVLELGVGPGAAACVGTGCSGCAGAGWRYGSCASLDHQPWAPAWPPPPPACCTHQPHPHAMHMHAPYTPQPYRRADSRAISRVGSRAGSRAASPAMSVRSRASRRPKHRTPSPPPLPSSDADSESESDSDHRPEPVAASKPPVTELSPEESLGPPPAAPSTSWQCEHCTFVNEPGVRVCAVCCRTPTAAPKIVTDTDRKINSQAQVNNTRTNHDNPRSIDESARAVADTARSIARLDVNDDASSPSISPARNSSSRSHQNGETKKSKGGTKERISTGCGPSPPREEKTKLQKTNNHLVSPTRGQSVAPTRSRHDMGVGPSPPRENNSRRDAAISPARENPTVRASPFRESVKSETPMRHSISVGPSPPRENVVRSSPAKRVQKKSTGTSPPRALESESSSTSLRANVSNTGTSPPPQSISTQTYEVPTTWERPASRARSRRRFRDDQRRERSHSRHSLSSDTRESERSARTSGGGGGGGGVGRWEWREYHDSSPGGEWSGSERRRAPCARPALARRASHLDLHRDARDGRDLMSKSRAVRTTQASPERTRAMSLEALNGAGTAAAERGLELARLMAEAERLGFSAAEVQAALAQSPGAPLSWLRERWPGLCAGVRAAAARLEPRAAVTDLEARAALARHRGAMWPAVTECVDRHRRQAEGPMTNEEGRLRGRVWGSPAGADDDAAPPRDPRLRAEDSSDEYDGPPHPEFRDDDWMYLPLDVNPRSTREIDRVRDRWERPTENDRDIWEPPLEYTAYRDVTDPTTKLQRLLTRAGVPALNENLILQGLLTNDAVLRSISDAATVSSKPNSLDLIQSENDFIEAYNALTRSTPLPNVDGKVETALATETGFKRDTHVVTENDSLTKLTSENIQITNQANSIKQNSNNHKETLKNNFQVQIVNSDNIQPEQSITQINSINIQNVLTNVESTNQRMENAHQQEILEEITNKVNKESKLENLPFNKSNLLDPPQISSLTEQIVVKEIKDSDKREPLRKGEEKTSNLNDIVDNTQRLIQQMKEEINSDINSIDSRNISQSEADTSSNESDISTEHESSFSESEEGEDTESISSAENESPSAESGERNFSERRPTIVQRTSSEENEQFEEAMDHIEDQIEDFKNTNIELLDSIARSLQEEHIVTVEPIQPTIVNVKKQDKNNNIFMQVNSFEEIYEELNGTRDMTSSNVIQNKASCTDNTVLPDISTLQTFEKVKALTPKNEILMSKHQVLFNEFIPASQTKLLISENMISTYNAIIGNIEESKSIHNDDENIDTANRDEVDTNQETHEEIQIFENNSTRSSEDTNHIGTEVEQSVNNTDNPIEKNYSRQENKDIIEEKTELIGDVNVENGQTTQKIGNSKTSPEHSLLKNPNENNGNRCVNNNKSNIPKLIKVVQNSNKQKGDKTGPKVIASKVPVRRASLKQYPAPAPPKSHFGNVQSGHVKQLQTRLFNDKLPKSVVNVTHLEIKPSTSTLHKKKPAPPPPTETKRPSPVKDSPPKEKKNSFFRESCRTEDEWTESDSEDSQVQVVRASEANGEQARPPSPPPPITVRRVSGQLIDLAKVEIPEGSPERQARMLLASGATETWEQAQLAVELVGRGAEPPAALLAALQCADLAAALVYLHQDCELCASRLPEYEMVSMLRCTHRCCRECARLYFTVQITERSIADCVCPYCKVPDLENLPEDAWLEYFAHLDILLKTLLETDVHELFQRKLRDRTLARDPNFRWCMECSSGFFVHPKQKKIRCPECRSVSCAKCRKTWSSNHEGLSCEQYTAWLEDNDPERSVAAVQQHLRENGLDCPRCHFKYSLSRGGCMHFTCTQCKYEFCYGCGKPFMMGARCGLSEYCAKLGLHAHHPRNCLFYLRDKEPHELQTLLQMNNVHYETETPEGNNNRCPIQLQRETPTGLVDGICGSEAPPKYAGLCKPHYVEYLAGRARGLDPIPIMDVAELVAELRRRALPLPERGPWDTDPIYAGMCAEIVKEKIPLD